MKLIRTDAVADRAGGSDDRAHQQYIAYRKELPAGGLAFCPFLYSSPNDRKKKQDSMKQELQELRMEIDDLKRQLADKNKNILAHVTPREMLLELRNRGYEGTLEYVSRKTVDLSKLE